MKRDLVIVGGGIIGLATAMRVLERRPGTRLVLLEKEARLAMHQTGSNSGVIHSGLYYKPGSLKATTCTQGYHQLVAFCRAEDIPHEICGKIVVAADAREVAALEELHRRGQENGLTGLRWLDADGIREHEPHCAGIRGLYVPQTGIVDYVAVANAMARKIESAGGEIVLGQRADTIARTDSGFEVATDTQTYTCRVVATCGGLHADRLARQTQSDLPIRIIPFRGEYYVLRPGARQYVRNLIYPVPDPAFPFLGVHFTRMVDGEVECGPNAVFAFAREGYTRMSFNARDTAEALAWPGFRAIARKYWRAGAAEFHRSFSKRAFVRALQRLIPALQADDLVPGAAGVRAQACSRDGKLLDDFFIVQDGRAVHVCNAPSPAATASLAIGATISNILVQQLD